MTLESQDAVHNQIDALGQAGSLNELIVRLKPILHKLAYYGTTGDVSILDHQEEWRAEFTNQIYGETESAYRAYRASDAYKKPDPQPCDPGGRKKPKPQPPPSNRPRPSDLPPTLRALIEESPPPQNNLAPDGERDKE